MKSSERDGVRASRRALVVLGLALALSGCFSLKANDRYDAASADIPATDTPAADTPAADTPAADTQGPDAGDAVSMDVPVGMDATDGAPPPADVVDSGTPIDTTDSGPPPTDAADGGGPPLDADGGLPPCSFDMSSTFDFCTFAP